MRVKGNKLVRSRPATRLVATLAMLAAAGAAAAQDLPQPRNHVDDRARVINDSAETQIIAVLAELEQKTGAQVIVLTIDTTGGAPIEDYALRTAERWKLGQKGKDNGVLVVVAVKDKQYRIEVAPGSRVACRTASWGASAASTFDHIFNGAITRPGFNKELWRLSARSRRNTT